MQYSIYLNAWIKYQILNVNFNWPKTKWVSAFFSFFFYIFIVLGKVTIHVHIICSLRAYDIYNKELWKLDNGLDGLSSVALNQNVSKMFELRGLATLGNCARCCDMIL